VIDLLRTAEYTGAPGFTIKVETCRSTPPGVRRTHGHLPMVSNGAGVYLGARNVQYRNRPPLTVRQLSPKASAKEHPRGQVHRTSCDPKMRSGRRRKSGTQIAGI